jgi:hypothetical protein
MQTGRVGLFAKQQKLPVFLSFPFGRFRFLLRLAFAVSVSRVQVIPFKLQVLGFRLVVSLWTVTCSLLPKWKCRSVL